MRSAVLLPALFTLLLTACEAGPAGGSATPTPTPQGDEAVFAAMLEGDIDVGEGHAEIAASGGWPIQTPSGFLFARLDDGNGPWSLAGDHDEWEGEPMALDNGVWWIRVVLSFPDGSAYKFMDGSGAFEPDAASRRYAYDAFGEISLVRESGAHLERFFDVTDGVVTPRTVRVRVPAATATHHLYVHDGQNLFDPGAPFGGWQLDETLGSATLAVGIDNTPARMDEYTHVPDDIGTGTVVGGDGDAYADFVHQTVRPLIEAAYGTPTRAGTMGSSLGGLIAFHLALRHPGEYDFAASLSGTMGWGSIGLDNQTMIERQVAAGHGATKLYLDSGGGPGSGCVDLDADGIFDDATDDADNYCTNRQLADELPGVGYVFDEDLWHWHEAGAAHDEAAWSARVFRPVEIFEAL